MSGRVNRGDSLFASVAWPRWAVCAAWCLVYAVCCGEQQCSERLLFLECIETAFHCQAPSCVAGASKTQHEPEAQSALPGQAESSLGWFE